MITQRQLECLMALRRMRVCGKGNTYRDLQIELGDASVSGTYCTVQSLRERGYVHERIPHKHYSIECTQKADDLLAAIRPTEYYRFDDETKMLAPMKVR